MEEEKDGEGEEDDDVEEVDHQPGHQQPPRPFLQCAQLRETTLEIQKTFRNHIYRGFLQRENLENYVLSGDKIVKVERQI